MTNGISRSLELLCPTCAGSAFEFDDNIDEIVRTYQCLGCGGSFSHDQIMLANASRIEAEVEAIGEELVGDAVKRLKKAFSGNKFIKIK
ncbi:hypothetical protein [Pseudotabrizicola sp.]|uniref:ECs_2282 family putative zinc-binding protein n=1 Tax=Pseudotabrizicola sp. TaxID=2939647 RepID=UPI00271FF12B|nr:hypothetical protein [Pseudotabrizicola sp.]MDO8884075.1 hypothetical protein [Pseudotabrizicola sp.]